MARELGTPLVIHQPSYSVVNRWIERGLLTVLEEHGLGSIGFTPLAQGLLTGKYLGYGHTTEQVAAVRAPGALLGEYLDAVHARTVQLLAEVSDLVSVMHDDMEHAGQAAYLRGLLENQSWP